MDETSSPARGCGACTLCCKLMGVPELKKPAARWCASCVQGEGCGVYDERPPSCRNFACFWLLDQGFPEEFRPDRIHALASFNDTPDSVVVHVDPAHKKAPRGREVRALIDSLLKSYARVFVVSGEEKALITR